MKIRSITIAGAVLAFASIVLLFIDPSTALIVGLLAIVTSAAALASSEGHE